MILNNQLKNFNPSAAVDVLICLYATYIACYQRIYMLPRHREISILRVCVINYLLHSVISKGIQQSKIQSILWGILLYWALGPILFGLFRAAQHAIEIKMAAPMRKNRLYLYSRLFPVNGNFPIFFLIFSKWTSTAKQPYYSNAPEKC